jgi:hypothetical protein
VGTASEIDHGGGKVNAEGLHPQRGQVGSDAAGTATEVNNGAKTCGRGQLGERRQHRPVQRGLGPQIGEEPGVVHSDGVVGRPRGVQVSGLIHTWDATPGDSSRRPSRPELHTQLFVFLCSIFAGTVTYRDDRRADHPVRRIQALWSAPSIIQGGNHA